MSRKYTCHHAATRRAYDLTMLPEESAGLAVEVLDLVKRYPKSPVNAVDGVSFAASPGKTTTVGMLTTRVRPTAGVARLGGVDVVRDPVRARAQLAVVPQRSNLDRSISIRDNLIFHAAYHSVPAGERERRADEVLDQHEKRAAAPPSSRRNDVAQPTVSLR